MSSQPPMHLAIDRSGYVSVTNQLADLLREQITTGGLEPGDRVPSSPQLATDYRVSSTTARKALDILASEGLIDRISGRGTFVRHPMFVRQLSSERYADQLRAIEQGETPKESAFTRDHGIDFTQMAVDCHFGDVPAPEHVAQLLGITPGTKVFERHMVMRAAGQAEQIRTSWYPLDLVKGTPMTDPGKQPWPGGVVAELAAIDASLRGGYITEDITARMPTPDESRTLRIPAGVPVFVITRLGATADRPVDVTDMTLPADRNRLHYRLDL